MTRCFWHLPSKTLLSSCYAKTTHKEEMTKREIENQKIYEVYERFKDAPINQIEKIINMGWGTRPYFKKGLNKVLRERGLKEI
jgi:hypothetical protein